ncbi:MAG TPA: hypothetical protein VFQ43_00325, partial [Nitrososphaera sp.]|nr:hypothetical protein [Nitrososphaera sp.]
LTVLLIMGLSGMARFERSPKKALRLTSQRQLFIDTHLIETMEGVRQTLHQPAKHPSNPVLRADKPWEKSSVLINGGPAVVYDDEAKSFKIWYFTYTTVTDQAKNFKEAFLPSYAISKDGIHWEKPLLGLVDHDGSKKNNFLPWESQIPAGGTNVLLDKHDPNPQRRYKSVYYSQLADGHAAGLYVSFSHDGIHWRDFSENPVLSSRSVNDTHTLLGWDKQADRYVGFLRPQLTPAEWSSGGVRMIGRSESVDFLHWTEPGKQIILKPDQQDPEGTEFYGMPVMCYEDIYAGLLWIYHNDPHWPWPKETIINDDKLNRNQQTVNTELVFSRDGIHWERSANRKPFLPLGTLGTWDDGCVYPTTPLVVGDEIWIYYGGMNVRHTLESLSSLGKIVEGKGKSAAVGLAKLRLDGFISIDGGAKEGILLTKPFTFSGDELWLNLNASRGSVFVEILDQELRPLPGFTKAQAIEQHSNSVRQPISWKSGSSLSSLSGKPIRLKFYIVDAELYSFWFSQSRS